MITTVLPAVHQAVEHVQEHPDVLEVEPGGGLVQDVEGPAGIPPGQVQHFGASFPCIR